MDKSRVHEFCSAIDACRSTFRLEQMVAEKFGAQRQGTVARIENFVIYFSWNGEKNEFDDPITIEEAARNIITVDDLAEIQFLGNSDT